MSLSRKKKFDHDVPIYWNKILMNIKLVRQFWKDVITKFGVICKSL